MMHLSLVPQYIPDFLFICQSLLLWHGVLCVCVAEHGPGIDIFTPGKPGDYELDGGIWEDEDARNFYENLVDLKAFVPAILFKDNEKSSQSKDKDDSKGAVCYVWCGQFVTSANKL